MVLKKARDDGKGGNDDAEGGNDDEEHVIVGKEDLDKLEHEEEGEEDDQEEGEGEEDVDDDDDDTPGYRKGSSCFNDVLEAAICCVRGMSVLAHAALSYGKGDKGDGSKIIDHIGGIDERTSSSMEIG
ncbi:hypothetical protein Sjap_015369 [Stephania japonica]|uniref:Uncharacterized protein n=1 Tax=Stephania japonica TaxID=461633 RepID=A0AAP0NQR7_9MAGN